jgi:signal transduction histidine kinase
LSIARYWAKSHLHRRTLLLAMVGASAILLLIGLSDYFSLKESIATQLSERLVLSKVVAGNLEASILQNLTILQGFSSFPAVNLSDDDLQPEKNALHAIALHSMCSKLFLLDRDGNILSTEPERSLAISRFSAFAPVRDVMATRKPMVSNLLEIELQRSVILLLIPVRQNGEVSGFLGGELDPTCKEFRRILEDASVGSTGFAEVLDGTGRVLASTRTADALTQSDHKGYVAGLIRTHQSKVATCHKCHESKNEVEKQVMAFTPLSTISWGVNIGQSEEEAFAPVDKMKKRYISFGILLLFVTMTVTWGIARSVTAPVHAFMQSAKQIASGNLNTPVPHSGSDEIGQLANHLDEMRLKLKESLETIGRMNAELEQRVLERTKEVTDLYEQLKQKEEVRSGLLLKILTAQEEERKRIARELHDQLSQKLTALLYSLDTPTLDPQKTRNLVIDSIDTIHQMIFDLRPAVLDDLGLAAAIQWYAENRLKPMGLEVRFENDLNSHRFSNELETVLFRIAQETISNIARHSKAENVLITLEMQDQFVTLNVEDDGIGFAPGEFKEPKQGMRGLGLWGMKERASLLNGTLEVESEPGNGTRVTVRLPIEERS